jgi:putative redox protein
MPSDTRAEGTVSDKTADIHHDIGMRFTARTGSGHELVMDDRAGDSGPRPTELVIAGLGACTAMDVMSILRKKRQQVTRLEVHVRATQREAYPQIFTDIEVEVEVEGPAVSVAAVCQAIELAARKYCSVGAMLAAGETTIQHRYHVVGTGAAPFDERGEAGVSGPFARPEAL